MSEKKLSVLFVGNSYTYYNDMPQTTFSALVKQAGYEVKVTAITAGGYYLSQFADPENEESQRLRATISGKRYDFAVLQEQSMNPIQDEERFLNGVKQLKELISADKFVLYATWGRNDDSKDLQQLGLTRKEMTEKLSAAYNKAGSLYGMRVAEVGKAFWAYSEEHNKDDLYIFDMSHPSAEGSAIAARVISETILGW